jgi:hypothetical protein
MTALAVQQLPPKSGRPRSRFYTIAQRIASRFEPAVAAAFLRSIERLIAHIDEADLLSAIASGNLNLIAGAAGAGRLEGFIGTDETLRRALANTAAATGRASAEILSDASGLAFRFNAFDPNVVMFARTQTAELVVAVGEDVREAIRIVVALGNEVGLTVEQQARAIREVVGLPPNWANAPLNLRRELEVGRFTHTRRLSAVEKAQIRKRIREGTIDEAFISRMERRYAESLRNRRALNIARTETLRASHHGQRVSWRQATRDGVLPATARRMFIVTPDDRLRETHAAVPGMNPDGVGLDEPFRTPLGSFMDPPIEVNCRCGVGLVFPGLTGVL